jgi:hypothetical protein
MPFGTVCFALAFEATPVKQQRLKFVTRLYSPLSSQRLAPT